jgi:predicted RNA-binding Zn-ribbon protein involved in translation (DUF1610 family)
VVGVTRERADFNCPSCEGSAIFRVEGTDGTYECQACGNRTHERIERHREELAEVAECDLPVADVAQLLLGGDGR